MSDVSINYKGAEIASLDDSGMKTLLTSGKYCEGDISIEYTKPSGGGTRTAWYRPPDWPDYDSLTLPNQSVIFVTIDTWLVDPAYLFLNCCWYSYANVGYYTFRVDRGYVENGEFVCTQTWDNLYFAIQHIGEFNDIDRRIPTDEGRFISYRFWCPSAVDKPNTLTLLLPNYTDSNGITYKGMLCPIVEVYFWKAGASYTKLRGTELATVHTMLHVFKNCLTDGGTNLYWNGNATRIPTYVVMEGNVNTNLSWYYPFNGSVRLERVIFKNMTMENTNNTGSAFNGSSRLSEITFENVTVRTVALNNCFANCSSLRSLDLAGWDVSTVTNASGCFNGCNSLINLDISGWNLSSVTNVTNMFNNTTALKSLTCSNTVLPSANLSFAQSSALSNASLVEIANALPTGAYTLTLHATPKAACSVIMGTVDNDVFTADDSGTVTLADYITNAKGWTLA